MELFFPTPKELNKLLQEISDKYLVSNILDVLKCLCNEYYRGPDWVLKDVQFSKREDDCISLDWLDRNIYCCVYPDLIAVDRVVVKNDTDTIHIEKEFHVSSQDSILKQFIPTFCCVIRIQ